MWKRIGLLVFLLLFVICTRSALADRGAGAQDLARQLVSPGWEDPIPVPDEPLIIYSLYLVELSSHLGDFIDAAIGLSVSDEPLGGYIIVIDDAILNWVGEYPGTFYGSLTGKRTRYFDGSDHNIQLITLGDKPVSAKLEEIRISGKEDEEPGKILTIALTPLQYDYTEKGILTDISVDYLNPYGTIGKAKLSTWIQNDMNPLAVIVEEVESKKQHNRKYFGLFASAKCIASSSLSDSGAIVPIGNIAGLQRLFTRSYSAEDSPLTKLSLGAGWLAGQTEFSVGAEFEREKYRIYASANGFPSNVSYIVGLNLNVYQGLGFALLLAKDFEPAPMLGIGLSDRVCLSDNLELEAVCLPFGYDWSQDHMATLPFLQFTAKIRCAKWGIWSTHSYYNGQTNHGLGIIRELTPSLDLQIRWDRIFKEEARYGLDIVFRSQ